MNSNGDVSHLTENIRGSPSVKGAARVLCQANQPVCRSTHAIKRAEVVRDSVENIYRRQAFRRLVQDLRDQLFGSRHRGGVAAFWICRTREQHLLALDSCGYFGNNEALHFKTPRSWDQPLRVVLVKNELTYAKWIIRVGSGSLTRGSKC